MLLGRLITEEPGFVECAGTAYRAAGRVRLSSGELRRRVRRQRQTPVQPVSKGDTAVSTGESLIYSIGATLIFGFLIQRLVYGWDVGGGTPATTLERAEKRREVAGN